VGGELNAYTGKEETFVYATMLSEDFERAMDVMADIVFNATFPKNEIEKEVEIILDEIQSYKDSPSELIFDDFEELVFAESPIGRNILGKEELLKHFGKKEADNFIRNKYHTNEMVFFSLGNIPFKKIIRWAEKYLACYPASLRQEERESPSIYLPQQKTINKDNHQIHVMIGNRAYSLHHPERLGLYLLNNIIGGPGMNSLLNLSLREHNGLVYNVESNYTAFSDTGIISIYLASDPKDKERCIRLVNKELKTLREEKISPVRFAKYKKQLIGQVTISSQNKENLALTLGKSFLHFNRIESIQETQKKLDNLSPEKLMEIANEVFDEKALSSLIYL
jgi:predicted Zn-dependent peptidase